MNKIDRKNKVIDRLRDYDYSERKKCWDELEKSTKEHEQRIAELIEECVLPKPPFKKWVKLESGEVIKAYYDDKLKEPRNADYDAEKGGFLIVYDKPFESGIMTCASLVVATGNTKKELM